MKINLSIQTKISKEEVIDHLKIVLFKCMLKIHELATINCPVDKGFLRASLIMNPTSPGYDHYIVADGVTYGIDVEFGTSPHIIRPIKRKALRFTIDNKTIFAKKVMHPGTEAQPFMRPALDQVKNVWVERFMNREFGKTTMFK